MISDSGMNLILCQSRVWLIEDFCLTDSGYT